MSRHPKRPRDFSQAAKLVVDIASGQLTERPTALTEGQKFAREGGLRGGKARAEKLSSKRRAEIARKAAKARWAKSRADSENAD